MRRQPVYILIDNSSSMDGKPIQVFTKLILEFICKLRNNPQAIEIVYISIIAYNSEKTSQIYPLTVLHDIDLKLVIKCTGKSDFDNGIEVMKNILFKDINHTTVLEKGDFKPLLYIMTGVAPKNYISANHIEFLDKNFGMGYGNEVEASIKDYQSRNVNQNVNQNVNVITYQEGYVYDYFTRYFEKVYLLNEDIIKKIIYPFFYYS